MKKNTTNWSVTDNKCSPFLTFVYPLQNELSLTAKNYALLLSPNNLTEAGKFILQILTRQIKQDINFNYYSQKNNCCQVFSRSRNNQPFFVS